MAYNKLVRDKIPQIIKEKGENPITRVLSDEEFLVELYKKLQEEVQEFGEDQSMEELADILEVIHGILFAKKKTFIALDELRKEKVEKRGGFSNKIFLERVEK